MCLGFFVGLICGTFLPRVRGFVTKRADSFEQKRLSIPFPKRGFVANAGGDVVTCDDPLLLYNAGWYYDHDVSDDYLADGLKGDCQAARASAELRFTPMHWCDSSLQRPVPNYVDLTYLMGFNEPNVAPGCFMKPMNVAALWGTTVMVNHPHSLYVSPAPAGEDFPWFDQFFGNCTLLYGDKGCRISHLAVHDYGCNAETTHQRLADYWDRYHLPIWLTEFSCGDAKQARPVEDQIKFMREVLPMLDAAAHVYRYAWMSARDPAYLRNLVKTVDGKAELTELGQIYNTWGKGSGSCADYKGISHPRDVHVCCAAHCGSYCGSQNCNGGPLGEACCMGHINATCGVDGVIAPCVLTGADAWTHGAAYAPGVHKNQTNATQPGKAAPSALARARSQASKTALKRKPTRRLVEALMRQQALSPKVLHGQ